MERQELYKIISRYHVGIIQYIEHLSIEDLQNYIIYLDILINKAHKAKQEKGAMTK